MTKPTVMKRALASAHLPGNLKLFLFGFYRKVSKRMTGIKSDDNEKTFIPRIHKTITTKMLIERKLTEWTDNPENDSKNPTLEELADALNIDKHALNIYFIKHAKKDFRIWRSEMKIKKARAMLIRKDNALDINQTAELLVPGTSRISTDFQKLYRLHSGRMEKHRRTPLREETELNYACWCAGRRRSSTTFTGLKVSSGTSTKQVFQSLMEPFHRPGSSSAFNSLP